MQDITVLIVSLSNNILSFNIHGSVHRGMNQ